MAFVPSTSPCITNIWNITSGNINFLSSISLSLFVYVFCLFKIISLCVYALENILSRSLFIFKVQALLRSLVIHSACELILPVVLEKLHRPDHSLCQFRRVPYLRIEGVGMRHSGTTNYSYHSISQQPSKKQL